MKGVNMNTLKVFNNQVEKNENDTYLLRTGVICLAVVSFFTTANGMKEYIFTQNKTISYLASAAIQGILLTLSLNLPSYIKGIYSNSYHGTSSGWIKSFFSFLGRLIIPILVIILTIVTLFCSSCFSYIYIADIIHQDSWDIDSELLVEQTYRVELYNAQEYAHIYRIYLEGSMEEKILKIDEQTLNLSDSGTQLNMDWDEEAENYAPDDDSTTSSYMSTVIEAMREAMKVDSTQEARDLAASAISDAQENIDRRMDEIQQALNSTAANITSNNDAISELRAQIDNASENTDTGSLFNSINNYSKRIEEAVEYQGTLQTEYISLERALGRLPLYESKLGLSSSTSSISIRTDLMQLQTEFFQQEPNEERMLDLATEIFDNLRSASRITKEGNALLEDEGEATSYITLLTQMNQLIQNLKEYSEIKKSESELDEIISSFHTEELFVQSGNNTNIEKEDDVSLNNSWKSEWGNRLSELKTKIGTLPLYNVSKENSTILSDSQVNYLSNYERSKAIETLNDTIRRYISEHNAIYQGIIYLKSPYRSLAIFALVLALSFDLSGFIFGLVIEKQNGGMNFTSSNNLIGTGNLFNDKIEKPKKTTQNIDDTGCPQWSILDTLRNYLVLTGDYEHHDGNYFYKTFQNGLLYQWAVKDESPYSQGIYICTSIDNEWSKGIPVSTSRQELIFALQNKGPQDGIYVNCQLTFDNGGLIMIRGKQSMFLTSIDEYVPAHIYDSASGENRTIPVKQLSAESIRANVAVVALNVTGTMVAAIYIIESV